MKKHTCNSCQHEWYAGTKPKRCPSCNEPLHEKGLGGGKRTPVLPCIELQRRHVWQYPSMEAAAIAAGRRIFAGHAQHDDRRHEVIKNAMMPNKERLAKALADSEALIDAAIAFDSRLAHRAQWRRRDEGEHCDSALLAQGDDQPFYKHTKQIVSDATTAGKRVRIVVSTDSNNVPEKAAAAFIAAIRIVQQFVPIEVWWQGSWLSEDKTLGFVFHVPLVLGDMDFSRLDYCIADNTRDSFSWTIMAAYGVNDVQQVWNGCDYRAEWSLMPGDDFFVDHEGVNPDPERLASTCCYWLGIERPWRIILDNEEKNNSALQRLPPEKSDQGGRPPTAEELERQKRWDKEWAENRRMEALQRTLAAQTVNI